MTDGRRSRFEERVAIAAALLILYSSLLDPRLSMVLAFIAVIIVMVYTVFLFHAQRDGTLFSREDDHEFDQRYQ